MASNNEFLSVGNQGWMQGFANLFRKENHLWWRTRRWWSQILIWMLIANGILYLVIGVAPKMDEAAGAISSQEISNLDVEGADIFIRMAGIAIAIGVVILGQGALIDEKQSGTAAWVLSKPVSRTSLILSKVLSNSLGILVTMAVAQGGIAYLIIYLITGTAFPVLPFAGAMGMLFVALVFWLTLAILLSTLSNSRGLAIGVPLILLLGASLFVQIFPWIGDITPWNLTTSFGANRPSMGLALVTGQPLPTLLPLFASLVWILIFIFVAIWRLEREEF